MLYLVVPGTLAPVLLPVVPDGNTKPAVVLITTRLPTPGDICILELLPIVLISLLDRVRLPALALVKVATFGCKLPIGVFCNPPLAYNVVPKVPL
jgi:hypothetical protein